MKRIIFIFTLCVVLISTSVFGQSLLSLIPNPASLEQKKGNFILSEKTRLAVYDEGMLNHEVAYLQQIMQQIFDRGLSFGEDGSQNAIVIRRSSDSFPQGGYRLDINEKQILLSSSHPEGIFYAVQTLKQLLFFVRSRDNQGLETNLSIPCLSITDSPAFQWRGLMLDVSRHFFSVEYLKKQVDMLAFYKMNKLHLHLTDDQGWRIEIKKYPELTQQGAWRIFNRQDSACMEMGKINPDLSLDPRFIISQNGNLLYGGFYSQDELKDLIQYARERHVEIVPEIDMPGHMMTAISIFPELSCTGSVGWGDTFSYPLCPCNEATFDFLENILDEVAALFPSRFIHIGIDEVEKNTWKESDACKNVMREKGFERVEQLQTYFMNRIRDYLSAKGKEVIAWDEVLEGEIDSNVNVMFWRDWVGEVPKKAVRNGNRIIFVPGSPLYFSRRDSSLYPIYHLQSKFNEVPEDKRELIRGAQACIWTEGVPSEHAADYLIYPRLLALAEAVWTPANARNWDSFKRRLTHQLYYLDTEQIKHPALTYALIPAMSVDQKEKKIRIELENEQINPVIYYTTDGSVPSEQSHRYNGREITVSGSAEICAAIYDKGVVQPPFARRSVDYHKAIGKPVTYRIPWHRAYPAGRESALTDGLRGSNRHNDGFWQGFTTDLDVTVDMQKPTLIQGLSAMFMQSTGPGIYMPEYVEVSLSEDGIHFEKSFTAYNDVPETERMLTIRKFSGEINKKARYIKVFVKNKTGHFMFTDELVVY
ncbi:MAG: family 20 glycosylhydrolase [Tannerellaceae bacterium]|jgi:hexosaminidase|nr:family 20 glycosylhydrolase [Tannerellaceae bacterium]